MSKTTLINNQQGASMTTPYLEIEGYRNVCLKKLIDAWCPRPCIVSTFIHIFHDTEIVIKKAQVHARSIDLTLEDDTQVTAYLRNTTASFKQEDQRSFGHDPQGREPVEGERLTKWGVIREAGGQVTMYILQKEPMFGCARAECNDYGVPTHYITYYHDKPRHLAILGSPLLMEMDGWWYVDSAWLKRLRYENAYTFEGARILYEGDPNATNKYDPCRG